MKVTTDACLFGAWAAEEVKSQIPIAIGTRVKNVLDVGTGTGLLSLMIAQKNPSSIIHAIEIDKKAYEQAKGNVVAAPFANCIDVIYADAKIFSFTKKYDIIVSNPPFYEKEIRSGDERKNIAHHHSGLLFEELLSLIKINLSPDGVFFILLPFKRNKEIKNVLLKQNLFISKIVFMRQSTNHDYFRIMIRGKLEEEYQSETTIDEISIWNDQRQYTDEFKELLKDYYLNL